MNPRVDVVIAVHDLRRPLRRAVQSVLTGTRTSVRVTVVGHGLEAESVSDALGASSDDERVRVAEFTDGVRSPAGPFNHGLDLATGEFTSVMGSDDVLDRGAVDSWLAVADAAGADVVISRLRHGNGSPVRTPPARIGRKRQLDGVRDRLAYRSAPLGLVSRARFGGLRFTPGVRVGEDVPYVNALWYSAARICLDDGPAYVIMDDADQRVTFVSNPIGDDLAFLEPALEASRAHGPAAVAAFVTKALRIHVFGAVHYRCQVGPESRGGGWLPGDREALAQWIGVLLEAAPTAVAPLSRADRKLLDGLRNPSVPEQLIAKLSQDRRRFGSPPTLVPSDVLWTLHREAPLRFMAASAMAGRGVPTVFRHRVRASSDRGNTHLAGSV